MKMANDKTQISNQIQMPQYQYIPIPPLDFDIYSTFGALAFDILKIMLPVQTEVFLRSLYVF